MRITVIVNQGAGSVVSGDVSAESLRQSFQKEGTEAEVHVIPGEQILETARQAVARGVDAVVAGGGDGTIRAVASVVTGGPVAMGVLPLGTLNHFARDLGIPTDLDEAVRLIPNGKVRALDVGDVNGEIFVNNSVLGFYPPVVKVRDWERREFGRNKWLATVSALFKVLPKIPFLHVHVKADGFEARRKTRFLFVGNNEYIMRAFNFGARERFDSGDLYLYIARTPSRFGLAGLALLSLVRDLKLTRGFDSWCLPEFTVGTRLKAIPVYLDGEVTSMKPPLRYRTRPRDLKVILPPDAGSPP
ncbi:MAG TPA: diacylglycerol kinase family protein [Thermoanaerobaculia bacterium]|jgi:diacylglycerol kinase family enzyme|nr:diacylglycerol kinase family protein [Thermoanaerobaculia bacterium]